MKRIVCLLLTLIITAAVFASCSGENGGEQNTGEKSTQAATKADTTKSEQMTDQSTPATEDKSSQTEPSVTDPAITEPTVTGSDEPEPVKGSDGLEYAEDDGCCIVVGIGSCTESDIVIASHINGVPVTKIDEDAFYENKTIKSVVIPWTVRSIKEDAFCMCENLESVTFSEGLEGIGESSFYGCSSLKSLTLPSTLVSVYNYSFRGCTKLEEVTMLGSTTVWNNAFADCTALLSFEVKNEPGYSYEIKNSAFSDSAKLQRLVLAPGLTSIGNWNFTNTKDLSYVYLPVTLKSVAKTTFMGTGVEKIYYEGNEEDWKKVDIKEPSFTPEVEYNTKYEK